MRISWVLILSIHCNAVQCIHSYSIRLELYCKCTATAMARYLGAALQLAWELLSSIELDQLINYNWSSILMQAWPWQDQMIIYPFMNGHAVLALEELIRPFRLFVDDHLFNACRINLHHLRWGYPLQDVILSGWVLISKTLGMIKSKSNNLSLESPK